MSALAAAARHRRAHRTSTWLTRTVVALALCLASVGCQRTPPADEGDLVWAIGANDAQPGGLAESIANMWNSQTPGPKVRVHALPASADDQRQLMATELNAELSGLDILTLDVVWTGEFAVNRWVVDLQDIRSRLQKDSLAGPLQSATWDGKLWGAPFISEAGFLYFRTDLVAQDKVPTTWEELVRAGLAAGRTAGIAPFVGQGAQYEGLVVNYLEYLSGAGGTLFDRDGSDVAFLDEPALQAVDFMRKARQGGFYAKGFDTMREAEATAAFRNGEAVFMRNWPSAYAELQSPTSTVRGRFGIAPLPTFGKGTSSITGGSNLAVSRFSQNREAAKQFVTFASTSLQVQSLLAKAYSRGPALEPVYESLSGDPVMDLLGRVLKDAKARPPSPAWSAISDEIQQSIFPAYTGALDPDKAVDNVRSFLDLTATAQP